MTKVRDAATKLVGAATLEAQEKGRCPACRASNDRGDHNAGCYIADLQVALNEDAFEDAAHEMESDQSTEEKPVHVIIECRTDEARDEVDCHGALSIYADESGLHYIGHHLTLGDVLSYLIEPYIGQLFRP